MASTKYKGITVQIGGDVSGLDRALENVNKEISSTQKNLRDVERLLKLDPTNTEMLEQRQRYLADAVEETKNKLDSLKEAERQVQAQFLKGDVSQEQYDELQREIASTEISLRKLEDAAQDSNSKLSKLFSKTGKISSGADKVQKAFAPVTGAIVGLGTAAVATVPATEELRSDLSKLDQNARESGVGVEEARKAWEAFTIQSGETDSAVEAVSNLLQAGFTESNLQKAVEGLAGATQRFPDTLKIESLADSLQETLAAGEATGQFGELLDRLGIGADNFSQGLANCATEAERQDYVLQTLAGAGLMDTYNAWVDNNQAMVDNKQANLDLQQAMAGLAETVLPFVTEITEKIADLLEWFNNLDSDTQNMIATALILIAAISPLAGIIGGITGAIDGVRRALEFLIANPIVALVAAIVGLVILIGTKGDEIQAILQKVDDFFQGIFAKDWTETFGILGNSVNAFLEVIKDVWDGVKQVLDGIIDVIRGVFTGDWERAWEGVKKIFKGIWDGMVGIVKAPINIIIGLINGVIDGLNWLIDAINKISFTIPDWVPGIGGKHVGFNIGHIGKIAYLADGGILSRGSAIVGEAGPELLTMMGDRAMVQPLTTNNTRNTHLGGINITVYGAPGQNVRELADIIMDEMQTAVQRREAVFG